MKYTFEPYKEDGSPRKWVGTFRPPYIEHLKKYLEENLWTQNLNVVKIAWEQGYADVPLYEDEE